MDNSILASPLNQPDNNPGDSYLKFQIDFQTTGVLSMEYTQEVLTVPIERITPMPNMHEAVLGLFNRNSRVLWVVDLAQLLYLQPIIPNAQQYNIVIIRVGQTPLGLIVQEVKGITRFTPDRIQPATGIVSTHLLTYLRGCILQSKEILLVLDAEAIVCSPAVRRN